MPHEVGAADAGAKPAAVVFDKPTPARMYDYFLGGKDNFGVDRAAADAIIAKLGVAKTRYVAWENRRFLWRAVEYLAGECGISQFIDVGAGLPTMRNTHEIAQAVNPKSRVGVVPAWQWHGGPDEEPRTNIILGGVAVKEAASEAG